MSSTAAGTQMYHWAQDLFPICRSLTGEGVRQTLRYVQKLIPDLHMHEVPTGTTCFDWTVPEEWNIRDAYVTNKAGEKIIDFACNNLHVVGYSEPMDMWLSLEELQKHLHSLPDQPTAIPYVTSYYKRTWGFCLSHEQRVNLKDELYHVVIDSTLAEGHMTYADLTIPGESTDTILLSTYVCHPSMANNELAGPVVQSALARWVQQKQRHYTYKFIFVPETIGSIYYLSRHLPELQAQVKAGFVLSCCGDNNKYSYLPSRCGTTLSDKVLLHVLEQHHPYFTRYTFLDRASDERQYQSPGVDLPIIPFARSLYRHFPEYHTSLDNIQFISPEGLQNSYDTMELCLKILESNKVYYNTCLCEPQLGKRGLYPTTSIKGGYDDTVDIIINFLVYCDGQHDLLDIAKLIDVPAERCIRIVQKLVEKGVLRT